MDKNSVKNYYNPKLVLLGFGIIILVAVLFYFLSSSPETKQAGTQVIPIPTQEVFPTTAPDKQVEGQIVVKFKKQYTNAQIIDHLILYHATVKSTIDGLNYKIITVPVGKENEIIDKLKTDPFVESAMPDYTNHATYIPNDPNFSLQYGLNNSGQSIKNVSGTPHADIQAEAAWDITKGSGIKVAILDTGIDPNHPEFAGKIVVQKVFATTSIDDMNGHATHVAGILSAGTNNGQGVAGTCPECQLIIGKVMNDDGIGSTSIAASGITWAADQGAKVINLSLRTTTAGSAPLYQQAVDYALSKGAVVVVAAGNDGSSQPVWPAANTGVVSVAATDNKDQKVSSSNFGQYVKVAAPGSNIYSTLPTHSNQRGVTNYGYLTGTSMASPFVAGVLALIWTTPYGTSNTAVVNRLFSTADKITGTGIFWTQGRINAARAVGASVVTIGVPTIDLPSPACVGGAGIPPCATFAPSPGVTLAASPIFPSRTTNPSITQPNNTTPSSNPDPSSVNPCASDGQTSAAHSKKKKKHKKHKSSNSALTKFIQMLLKLIESILKQLNVQLPPPIPTPNPTQTPPFPCQNTSPQVSPEITIDAPSPQLTPEISNQPSVTSGVTTAPAVTGGTTE